MKALLVFIFLLTTSAYAQESFISITGKLVDSKSKEVRRYLNLPDAYGLKKTSTDSKIISELKDSEFKTSK